VEPASHRARGLSCVSSLVMRIIRFRNRDHVGFGLVERHEGLDVVFPLAGDPILGEPVRRSTQSLLLRDLTLLAPAEPSKIVAVGQNYAAHRAEVAGVPAEHPRIFLKPPSALIAADEAVRLPTQSQEVHYEAELAVVIGVRCRNLTPSRVPAVVFGYTCANDITARDLQRLDGQPTYAKSFDSFCPLGPWVETSLDPTIAQIQCRVNGEIRQDDNTENMLWPVVDLVSYISSAMTLNPGDVVLTGTPAGVGPIRHGDEMAVDIAGIGVLTNPVMADH
jgi:2-keto-4-pentenoate hydratase/2-oxohepta-3-ene-1,7-dioic acid hydratase in catechol pathway